VYVDCLQLLPVVYGQLRYVGVFFRSGMCVYCQTLLNIVLLLTLYDFPDSLVLDKLTLFCLIKCFHDTQSVSDKHLTYLI
jgi:uncharacterized membrane protein YqaE (UPF0057 family)